MKRTDQQIFDQVWKWFIVDKHPRGGRQYGGCVYVGSGKSKGKRCGIGCLLPKNFPADGKPGGLGGAIETILEGTAFDWENENGYEAFAKMGEEGFLKVQKMFKDNSHELLKKIQAAHDGLGEADFHFYFKQDLIKIAKEFGLKVPKGAEDESDE